MVLRVVHGTASGLAARTRLAPARALHRVSHGDDLSCSQVDHLCGVLVCVCLVPTCHACEDPATPRPVGRVSCSAPRTGLRGARSWYRHVCRAIPRALVIELAPALSGGVIENSSVQPRLGCYVRPRTSARAPGRAGHVLHAQVLGADVSVVLGEVGGELVGEVETPACLAGSQPCYLCDGSPEPLRVPPMVVLLRECDLAVEASGVRGPRGGAPRRW